jgi:predicted phosphodiesterase
LASLAALEFSDHVAEDVPVLCVHSEPGRDDGPGLAPELSSGDLAGRLKECGVTVICVGHIHRSIDRSIDGTRLINPGAVSLSSDGDGAAHYAVFDRTGGRLQVYLRSVPYDRESVIFVKLESPD